LSDNQPDELTFHEYGRRRAHLQFQIRAAENLYAVASDLKYTVLVKDYEHVILSHLDQVRGELEALKTRWYEQEKQNRVRK
jgi:hypothetical protein